MPAEAPKKHGIHDRVEDFAKKTFEQAEAKKIVIRNLKGLMHEVIRIQRKNLLIDAEYASLPLGMAQPGSVFRRRVGEIEWKLDNFAYNECRYHEHFTPLVGMVIGYEIEERETGGSVSLIIAAPNDRFEYRFNIASSVIEVLDGFPSEGT